MGTTGPNLVPNFGFDADLSGWTGYSQSAVAWTGGRAQMTALSASNSRRMGTVAAVAVEVYKRYLLTADLEVLSGDWFFSHINISKFFGNPTEQFGPGVHRVSLASKPVPVGFTPGYIYVGSSYPGQAYIDNVQLLEVIDMSTLIVGLRDFDGDKPQTSLALGPVTDGTSYVTREGQAAAVRDAVNAVCGNVWRYQFLAVDTEPNDTNAANQAIQANHRWKVTFVDSVTGDNVYWYIPCADLTVADLLLPSSSKHNPATQAWIDFKAAVNGIAINKKTGSTMNVIEIEYEE